MQIKSNRIDLVLNTLNKATPTQVTRKIHPLDFLHATLGANDLDLTDDEIIQGLHTVHNYSIETDPNPPLSEIEPRNKQERYLQRHIQNILKDMPQETMHERIKSYAETAFPYVSININKNPPKETKIVNFCRAQSLFKTNSLRAVCYIVPPETLGGHVNTILQMIAEKRITRADLLNPNIEEAQEKIKTCAQESRKEKERLNEAVKKHTDEQELKKVQTAQNRKIAQKRRDARKAEEKKVAYKKSSPVKEEITLSAKDITLLLKNGIQKIQGLLSEQKSRKETQVSFIEKTKNTIEGLKSNKTSIAKELEALLSTNEELRELADDIDISHLPPVETTEIEPKTPNGHEEPEHDIPKEFPHAAIEALDITWEKKSAIHLKNRELQDLRGKLKNLIKENTQRAVTSREVEYEKLGFKRQIKILEKRRIALLTQNPQLEALINDPNAPTSNEGAYPPLSEMKVWIKGKFPKGQIIILKRAYKEATASRYESPELIYNTVKLLGEEFWRLSSSADKTPATQTKLYKQFQERAQDLHLNINGGTLSDKAPRDAKERHSVIFEGKKVFLDLHLGKSSGSARDVNRCLRVYYSWLEDKQAVLIGHMPSHL